MEGSKQVYVGNLAWTTNSEQLLEFLLRAGGVLSAQVQRHEDTKRSKGWGLAEFVSPAAALNAIAMLDKSYFNGRQVHLRLDRRIAESGSDKHCSIFVGNVQWAVTQQELLELFSAFSPLDCNILTNMYGRSKGFAIVKFASEGDAGRAIDAMNHLEFRGRSLECRFDRGAGKTDSLPEERGSIFVSKLGPTISEDDKLASLFRHIGPVEFARLQKAPNGKSKGWGIVAFQDPKHARAAVVAMQGQRLPGALAPLEVHLDRKNQL